MSEVSDAMTIPRYILLRQEKAFNENSAMNFYIQIAARAIQLITDSCQKYQGSLYVRSFYQIFSEHTSLQSST